MTLARYGRARRPQGSRRQCSPRNETASHTAAAYFRDGDDASAVADLRELTTDDEWDRAVPILRQLWSHREEAFVRSWREEDDYRLFGWYVSHDGDPGDGDAADLVAVAGVSIQRVLHHERHLWIHDFVVDEPRRGEGHGAALLDRLEEWARERDCQHLSLACVADNDDALAFYEPEGLEEWGSVLETEL